MISRRTPWIAAGLLAALLTTTFFAAQKADSADVLLRRAVQKEKVDGDTKAAIDLYKQVLSAPGASQKLKAQAQASLTALLKVSAAAGMTARLICSNCADGNLEIRTVSADGRFLAWSEPTGLAIRDVVLDTVVRPKAAIADPDFQTPAVNSTASRAAAYMAFSPDGQQIAYQWRTRVNTGSGGEWKSTELRIVSNSVDGKPRTLLSSATFPDTKFIYPQAWAPDGKSILVTIAKPDKPMQMAWVSLIDGKVSVLQSLGQRIGLDDRPSISPDGRYIAYSALPTDPRQPSDVPHFPVSASELSTLVENAALVKHDIYVIPANGSGSEVVLVKGADDNISPGWMPDGKSILFISNSNRGGTYNIWSASIVDGKPTGEPPLPVRRNLGDITGFGVTKTGSYYYEDQGNLSQIQIKELDEKAAASRSPKIIPGILPSWAPDGKHIVFYRPNLDGSTNRFMGDLGPLIAYSLDTGDEKLLASGSLGAPVWFHDGKALLVRPSDSSPLYRVDLMSGDRKVIPTQSPFVPIALTSDDKILYQYSENFHVIAIDLDTGQKRDVFAMNPGPLPLLARDDKTLYVIVCEEAGHKCNRVSAVDAHSGAQKTIFTSNSGEIDGFLLSADGGSLAIATSEHSPTVQTGRLIRVGTDGSGNRTIYEGPRFDLKAWLPDGSGVIASRSSMQDLVRIPIHGGTFEVVASKLTSVVPSPDGLRIAVSSQARHRDIWALENVSSFLKTAR